MTTNKMSNLPVSEPSCDDPDWLQADPRVEETSNDPDETRSDEIWRPWLNGTM